MATEIKTHADFQKYNFFRTPAWRWERVLTILDRPDRPGRCARRDDHIIRAARSFALRWQNGDEHAKTQLQFQQPALFFAYDYHQREADDPDNAMYIQARLLAGQTPEQIGDIMGLMPESIQWYADVYFDVIPYLKKRDWITKQVLLPALARSGTVEPAQEVPGVVRTSSVVAKPFMDGSLKLLSYFGGIHLVDSLIALLEPGLPVASKEDMGAWYDKNIANTQRRRTLQASLSFEINKYNVMELFQAHARILEIEKSDDAADRNRSVFEKHVKSTIDAIPWSFGADGEKASEGTIVGKLDKMAGELRDDELLLLASGRVVPSLVDNFPKELPPPRKDKQTTLPTDSALE